MDSDTASISGSLTAVALPGGGNGNLYQAGWALYDATTAGGVLGPQAFQTLGQDANIDASGNFTIKFLAAGTYKMRFFDLAFGTQTQYAPQWFGGSDFASAATFTLGEGQATGGVNVVLQIGAKIYGTVQGAGTPNTPVANTHIYAYGSKWSAQTSADANGVYSLPGLPADSYRIGFYPDDAGPVTPWAQQWWSATPSQATASPISVSLGQTYQASPVLNVGGKITGQMLDGQGNPLTGTVSVYSGGAADDYTTFVKSVATNGVGFYAVPKLVPGSYKVGFTTASSSFGPLAPSTPYRPSWYSGASSYQAATPVVISSVGQTVGTINGSLQYDPSFTQNWANETTGGANPAEPNCQCAHSDPVNTATGEFFDSATDLTLPGVGPTVGIERTYSSTNAATNGPFGFGWAASFSPAVSVVTPAQNGPPQVVQVVQENGAAVRFTLNSNNQYVAPPRVNATLIYDFGTGGWTFTRKATQIMTFNSTGQLTAVSDLDHNSESLTYDANGHVVTIGGSAGRVLTLTWTGPNVTTIADQTGRSSVYSYDASGNLQAVRAVDASTITYTYDATHRLTIKKKPTGGTITNAYDTTNRVISQTNELGKITSFAYSTSPKLSTTTTYPDTSKTVETYDSTGLLLSQTTASGTAQAATTTFGYDTANNVTTKTDPLGNQTVYTYDSRGNVQSRTDALNRTTSWYYNSLNDVTFVGDPLGQYLSTSYSPSGHPVDQTDTAQHDRQWTYNADGTLATSTDPLGRVTTYGYTPSGLIASVTDPDGRVTATGYTAAGFVASRTDAAGKITSFTVDPAGRVLTATDPDLHTTTYTYDADGNQLTKKDAAAHTTSKSYDLADQMTTSTTALSKVTTYTYTAIGLPASIKDPNGNTTSLSYDAAHHIVTTKDADGRATTNTYDLNGRKLSTKRPSGATTTTAYDADGEPLTVTDPNGKVTTTTYDADGQKKTVKDPLNRVTSYGYTNTSQLSTITLPSNKTETYAYDAAGETTTFTNADSKAATYTYDAAGLLTNKTEPGGITTGYTYDAAGRPSVTTLPDHSTETATYDSAGQLTGTHYSATGSTDSTFTYNAIGQRISMVDSTGTTTYTYDNGDRLTAEKNAAGVTLNYAYDNGSRLSKITYPGTHAVTYGYDKSGDITKVTDWASHATTFTWTGDRQIATQVDPNGLTQTSTYDPDGHATAMTTTTSTATIANYSYGYDNAGQLTSDTTVDPTTTGIARTFGYDSNSQLQSITTGGIASQYSATAAGVLTKTPSGPTMISNAAQELTTLTPGTGPATTYAYNANGARTSSTIAAAGSTPAATATYTYTAQGSLASATPPTSSTITYSVDGDGLRQSRSTGGTTTRLLWSTNASVPRLLDDGSNSYIYGPTGTPIERINDSTQTPQYLLTDAIGSVRLITDTSGAVLSTNRYDAYGNRTTHTGTVDSVLGYAGSWTDPTTKLVYLQARDYDPATAQFTTIDPAIDTTRQPYAYAANNPLAFTDPTGLDPLNDFQDWLARGLMHGPGAAVASVLEGIGDGASFGLTALARNAISPGSECMVNKNGFYFAGVATGVVATTIASAGASAEANSARLAEDLTSEANAAQTEAALPAGYKSFSAAKRALGSPGDGNVYDHVVEQSQIGRSGFDPAEIHNPYNMNPVSAETNQLKANYYSSIQAMTGGQTVRDWLSGQTYAAQYEFGLMITNRIEQGALLP